MLRIKKLLTATGIAALIASVMLAAAGCGSIDRETDETGADLTESESQTEETIVDENVSYEFKTALKKAKTYSDMMHMSKKGIYDQLTSEYADKFPADAAQYAVDNLKADFKDNALKKAKTYSDTMHMSKKGIYDQLTSEHGEKFTEEEAQYAIDNLEADYKQNALKKAESYRDTMSMSKNAIKRQLTSEYGEKFTEEEAQYAIDNLD